MIIVLRLEKVLSLGTAIRKWLLSKRQNIANVGKDAEKLEPLSAVNGNIKSHGCWGKQCDDSSKNEKN